jgi:DNA topoisomerase-1
MKGTQDEKKVRISKRKLSKLVANPARSAAAINLRYVCGREPGIRRIRKGPDFSYDYNGTPVTDEKVLERIRALVLPPAWEDVWICKDASGHLQSTGIDVKGRKQYKYHPEWSALRSQTKFFHLYEFGKALPAIRACIDYDLTRPGLPEEKVLAVLVAIMLHTGIRIGNAAYEKRYGSFGLSTLKDKHVRISGSEMKFSFLGKKGVAHELSLKSLRLARLVRQCRDIPGEELFQYIDASGQRHPIDSGMVNAYIRQISGGNFTAKDFRTWTGTLTALQAFRETGCDFDSVADARHRMNTVLDAVSRHLGNTRAVCRKYYVHPVILDLYERNKLGTFLHQSDAATEGNNTGLKPEEEVLMKILEKC